METEKKTGPFNDGISARTILLAFATGAAGGAMVTVFCVIHWLGGIWRAL